eukprot:m.164379 g.164379  ORF g.164379 m.164379 type:complete len:1008 (+) comp15235_c0_seq2:106-3129(+)
MQCNPSVRAWHWCLTLRLRNPSGRQQALAASTLSKNYEDTLLLPKTRFPMRANAAVREIKIQEAFKDIYHAQYSELGESRKKRFILHDGPPFANGPPHLGHALNKILKDIISRYRILQGDSVSYVPGWDCHGLPIELLAMKAVTFNEEEKKETVSLKIRKIAHKFAKKAIQVQKKSFQRWGVLGDWDEAYLTMNPKYEAAQLDVFFNMYQMGLIYRGLKPVYWSPSSRTALAEAELEYQDHTSQAVYVHFPLILPKEIVTKLHDIQQTQCFSALTWTTTPWTLPANRALAVNPSLQYGMVHLTSGSSSIWTLLCLDCVEAVRDKLGASVDNIIPLTKSELLSITYKPLFDEDSGIMNPIISATHVTSTAGTGIVHTAPHHGVEDFVACERENVTMGPGLVDDGGLYTSDAGIALEGLSVLDDGNAAVISSLRERDLLALQEDYEHRYPYDWRTKQPIILRATPQWFANLTDVSRLAQDALDNVEMIPEYGRNRLVAMIRSRTDWCISRQRVWGVPIPVFYDKESNEVFLDNKIFEHVRHLVSERGTDCWWYLSTEDLLPDEYKAKANSLVRGLDTMDVWFDSGSSWNSVVRAREGPTAVADVYLEGSDQHRGWFQSSLLTAVSDQSASSDTVLAPYKTIITHGFVVDKDGRKMSKSLGNGIDPDDIINGVKDKNMPAYGADVLRLWVASNNYSNDVAIGPDSISMISEQLRKFRNCGKFLLGNISDFDIEKNGVDIKDMCSIDRYMIYEATQLLKTVKESYESYKFISVSQNLQVFVATTLSAFYFEILKDRVYLDPKNSHSRRSAQTALHHILEVLAVTLAPIVPHLAEELNSFRAGVDPSKERPQGSIMLHSWPSFPGDSFQHDEITEWSTIRRVRKHVSKAVDDARQANIVNGVLDANITLSCPSPLFETLNLFHDKSRCEYDTQSELLDVLQPSTLSLIKSNTSLCESNNCYDVEVGANTYPLQVTVSKCSNHKCPRCWRYTSTSENRLCQRCFHVVNLEDAT